MATRVLRQLGPNADKHDTERVKKRGKQRRVRMITAAVLVSFTVAARAPEIVHLRFRLACCFRG